MSQKRFFVSLLTIIVLTATSAALVLLARGYRFDIRQREVQATGILVVNSTPDGALIYLNDEAKDATNTSITALPPGTYHLRLEKQGYAQYQRKIEIKKELVTKVEAVLLPLFPELKPLTFTGATSPTLSPDGSLIVYTATRAQNNKGESSTSTPTLQTGLWLLPLSERPFNLAHQPSLLLPDTQELTYSQMPLEWSPDSQQILLIPPHPPALSPEPAGNGFTAVKEIPAFVVEIATRKVKTVENTDELDKIKEQWQAQEELIAKTQLEDLPETLAARIQNLPTKAVFSPDQTKLFYREEDEGNQVFKVIDTKPKDALPTITAEPAATPAPTIREHTVFSAPLNQFVQLVWYPDSQHLLVLEKESADEAAGIVSLVELNGANPTKIFSGQIQQNFVAPDGSGGKIVILTNFNPQSEQDNLYAINLR